MLSRLKFEISPLVKEMLDQLPSAVWSSSSTTFLDPSMGGGQFLVEIERRLRASGHSDENISARVFGCEKNKLRVNYAKNNKKLLSKNLHISDFLSYNWGKKSMRDGKAVFATQQLVKGIKVCCSVCVCVPVCVCVCLRVFLYLFVCPCAWLLL